MLWPKFFLSNCRVRKQGSFLEKGSLQKSPFSKESRDFRRESPDSGKQRRIRPSSGDSREFRDFRDSRDPPVKDPFRNDRFFLSQLRTRYGNSVSTPEATHGQNPARNFSIDPTSSIQTDAIAETSMKGSSCFPSRRLHPDPLPNAQFLEVPFPVLEQAVMSDRCQRNRGFWLPLFSGRCKALVFWGSHLYARMLCTFCPLTILGDFYRIPEKSPRIVRRQNEQSMRVKRSDPQKD